MTPFIRGFQRDLLVMSCLSESQKTSVKLQRGLWSRQTASTSNVRNIAATFLRHPSKMRLRFVTVQPALILMDVVSPKGQNTSGSVHCNLYFRSRQLSGGMQGERVLGIMKTKSLFFYSLSKRVSLCVNLSLKCTRNISSPIAGRDTAFSNGPNVCGDGFSQTTKQIFYHSPPEVPSKST